MQEKRLFTGPWYTQTDTKMVSLESIVSNLYYGIWRSKDLFGDYMKCGYLPDTFGFSGQLPMITGVPEDWAKRYVEYPVDIEMNTGFAGYYGEGEQLTVFNKGSREYQAVRESIYMTLFASCSELGKPDLLYRPGRASGDTTKKGHVRIPTYGTGIGS